MGNDKKELSITITNAPAAEHTVTVTNDGNGTGAATPSTATAGTTITLTATPDEGYHFKEWQVMRGGVTIKDDKFLMPNDNVEVKAIFEKDAPPAPTEFIVTFDGNGGTPSVGSMTTTNQKLTSLPSASRSGSYSFDGWYTEKSGGTKDHDGYRILCKYHRLRPLDLHRRRWRRLQSARHLLHAAL